VSLSSATVACEVYRDGSFTCSASTVEGVGRGPYSPEDEDDSAPVPVGGPRASVVRR
jgi:hypothetical protein